MKNMPGSIFKSIQISGKIIIVISIIILFTGFFYNAGVTSASENEKVTTQSKKPKSEAKMKEISKNDKKQENDSSKIKDVPDWAKDAVWYQVFPERFRNGDPTNDPTLEDTKEKGIKGWKIRSWGSDWYGMDEWEKDNFDSVYQSIFRRRYGGDLQGVIDKLDYLKSLGVTAIYINPVFRAPSLHKYDGSCFHHVEETFGPDPQGDRKMIAEAKETEDPDTWVWTSADKLLLKLIKEAHKRDLKVIIDGVFNHSGRYFFAFEDILKNGKKSRYADWYEIEQWDKSLPDGFEYKGWFGIKSLPEFKRDENTLNAGYRRYLSDITKRWMAPDGNIKDGIDGWRLDVAFCVPHGFWKEWRKHVKSINPSAYLTAEVVKISPEFLRGDEFDATMNYPFAYSVSEFFIDRKNRVLPTEFDNRLRHLRNSYPEQITYVMQNLMSSHDSPRLRTLIVNPDMRYRDWSGHFERSKVEKNPDYRIDRGNEDHRKIHKLIAIFQMTYLGAPMIYYGDEIGMTGANDPDCRKPMIWEDIEYKDEVVHPAKSKARVEEKNEIDRDLLDHYKKMIRIRNEHPALRRGDFETLITDDKNRVYAFQRTYKNERAIVVINNSDKKQDVNIKFPGKNDVKFTDVLNGDKKYDTEDEILKIPVNPKWAVILVTGLTQLSF